MATARRSQLKQRININERSRMMMLDRIMKVFRFIRQLKRNGMMAGCLLLAIMSADFATAAGIQITQNDQIQLEQQFVLNQKMTENQQQVSLELDEVPLVSALRMLAEKVQVGFSFQEYAIPDKKVTVSFDKVPVYDALDTLLAGTYLEVALSPDRETLIIRQKLNQNLTIQLETVSGTVTDAASGETLPGVNIMVKGTTTGTSTDSEGNYELDAPSLQDTLIFSFVGYQAKEVPINGRIEIDVILQGQAIQGEEMVVVGYGTQQKSDLTGSVSSVDVDNFEDRPIMRIDQALVGQMAGVRVEQTTGVPGQAFSINIRGSGSISAGNEPLYVVDGFPLSQSSPNGAGSFSTGSPLDNINPSDIASIEILKDASAAAIYGSRAANGVVLITTMEGKQGRMQVEFSSTTGFTEASRKLDMLSAEEWVDRALEMQNDAWEASGPGRSASQSSEERRAILGLSEGEVDVEFMHDERWLEPGHPGLKYIDWQDEAFRKGFTQNYQLSVSGGNDKARYYISGNYGAQEGMIKGLDYTNYSARMNLELTPSEDFTIGIKLSPSNSILNDPGVEGKDNILQHLVLFSPVQEADAGIYANSFNNGQYKWGTSANSVIARLESNINETKISRTLASLFADYEITDGLAFRASLNLDNTDSKTKGYIPYTVTGPLTSRQNQPNLGTSGSYAGYDRRTIVQENTLTYTKSIGTDHTISALAGTSYNSDKLENFSLSSREGYVSSTITTLNAASEVTGTSMESKNVLLSYFGRVQYSYQSKYLFSGSIRRDGSSRFGENTKWGWFPAASVGWRVSEESFFDSIELINNLKLRASWGTSGNYNIGDYSSLPLLVIDNYSFNGSQVAGQAPGGIVNPDLSWEKSQTFDVGFDVGLLDDRVSASFDYYNKLNTDLLLNTPIPASTGFQTSLNNVGKVRNRGWEAELKTFNVNTGKFQWSTSVNFSHNTNEVVELAGGQDQILIPSSFDISHSILKVGEPMYSIYVVKQIGLLTQQDIDQGAALFGNQMPGDPKYLDANGDGGIDGDDRVIVGHPNPDYIWGISNSFKYKKFDLSFLVQGQWGGSIYSLLGRAIFRTGQDYTGNVLGVYRDRWHSPENPGNGVRRAYSDFGRIKNTDWMYPNDYWRLRNITLGYTTDVGTDYVDRVRIFVSAENWLGHDKYVGGFNPEAANTDLSGSSFFPQAGDYGGLPLAKSLILGLKFTF